MSGLVTTGASYSKNVATTYTVSGPKIIQVNNITASGNAPFIAFVPYSDPAEPYAQAEAVFDITLSANCTVSFLFGSAVGIVQRLTLILRQPASGTTFTATLPSGVKYAGGSPPTVGTAAGSVTVIGFMTPDNGATILGGL